jgi:hypothetical protein
VQFLAHIEQERTAVLETTARTFTAGFLFDMREELHVDDVLKVTFPVRRVVCDSKSTVFRSIDSEVLRLTWGPENSTLTVTNNPSDGECDLQYGFREREMGHDACSECARGGF